MLSFLFAAIVCGCFYLFYEKSYPKARDIMPVIVICVIASLGRIIFQFAPQIQPVTAIVIIMGCCYGSQTGFLTGSLCALISNMILGQGPWTLWQMLAWGTIGFLAGILRRFKYGTNLIVLSVFAFFSAFLYSLICDIWTVSSLGESLNIPMAVGIFMTGILFNIGHAIGNVLFILVLYRPLSTKLRRLTVKYGVLEGKKRKF